MFKFVSAIIVAGGKGERFSDKINKLTIPLNNIPVIEHSLIKFNECSYINEIILVTSEEIKSLKLDNKYKKIRKIVDGGIFREESVYNGFKKISEEAKLVIIHDAARPLFPANLIEEEINEIGKDLDGVVPVMPIYDAVKIIRDNCFLDFDREIYSLFKKREVKLTQTPQTYRVEILKNAFEKNIERLDNFRDEAELILTYNNKAKIKIIRGSFSAYKLTEMEELKIFEVLLSKNVKTGIGYDFHPFSPHRALIIGGIEIPYKNGLLGDSDADVLSHSIIDALLGALGKGDIGSFFGVNTDKVIGVKSTDLLSQLIGNENLPRFEIINIDSTIICKEPNMTNQKDKIIENLSEILKIDKGKINIKATTDKGFDAAGSGLGIRAITIITINISQKEQGYT